MKTLLLILGLVVMTVMNTFAWEGNLSGKKIIKMEAYGSKIYILTIPSTISGPYLVKLEEVDTTSGSIVTKYSTQTTSAPDFFIAAGKAIIWREGVNESTKVVDLVSGNLVTEKVYVPIFSLTGPYEVGTNYGTDTDIAFSSWGNKITGSGSAAKVYQLNSGLTKTDSIDLVTSGKVLTVSSDFTTSYVLASNAGKIEITRYNGTTTAWTKEVPGNAEGPNEVRMIGSNAYVLSGNQLSRVDASGTVTTVTINGTLAPSSLSVISGNTVTTLDPTTLQSTGTITTTSPATDVVNVNGQVIVGGDVIAPVGPTPDPNPNPNPDPNGIEEITGKVEINIYPNPTTDYLNIQIDGIEKLEVMIFDRNGVMVGQYNETTTIDVSSLNTGVYFCNINGIATLRFIKR